MSENHEPNAPSEGTSEPEPESIIPEDAVELETVEADQRVAEKLEEVAELPVREMVLEPLSQPFRAVIWFKYEELRERFDAYWNKVIGPALEGETVSITPQEKSLIKSLRIKGKKGKGGKMKNAQKMAEKRRPPSVLYYSVLGEILRERIEKELLFVEGVQLFDFVPDKQAQLGAVFHYMPELEMEGEINWECVKPPMPSKQQQFEARLKELQRQFRTLKDDPEGVITEQSNVCMDIDAFIDDEQYVGGTINKQWVEVAGIPIPELRDHLLGKKVGDEFKCEFTANKLDTDHGGENVQATIRIHNLQQVEIPEVDDKLAQDAEFDDLKSFEERFDKDYTAYVKRAEQSILVDHVIKQIVGSSPVPSLPMQWIKFQTDGMAQEHLARFRGDRRKAMDAIGVKGDDAFEEYFRGQLYRQFMQQLALKLYEKMFKVEPGSDEMFASMMSKVRWIDAEKA
jgi:FKBP-type peptidyl-prolyl cis-trans isomerase (trigger factor)